MSAHVQDAVLPSKGPPSPLETALDLQASAILQLLGAACRTWAYVVVLPRKGV